MSARALLFHRSNPCDKSLQMVPTILTCDLGVCPTFCKLNIANNISTVSAIIFIFHMNIPFVDTKPFDLDI